MNDRTTGGQPRLIYFDALKLMAIFLVLEGHCVIQSGRDRWSDEVFLWLSSFHMPLFMILVGYFAKSALDLKPVQFLGKKVRQLLLPIVSWSVIFYVVGLILIPETSLETLKTDLLSTFWFLRSAFVCFVLLYLFKYIFRNNLKWSIIISLLISIVIYNQRLAWMYPFFITGVVMSYKYSFFEKVKKQILIISIILFTILWITCRGEVEAAISMTKIPLSGPASAFISYLKLYAIHLLFGLSGSLMWISIFAMASEFFSTNRIAKSISKVGSVTLLIYILQTFILERYISANVDWTGINWALYDFVIAPVLSILIISFCYLMSIVINKFRISRFLLLGKNR